MSFAICFKLDQSKILSSGNGLKDQYQKTTLERTLFSWVVKVAVV